MSNDTQYEDFPAIPDTLITALDARFPDVVPESKDMIDISHLQGQVSVVRLLKRVHDAQSENILTKG
jgi:D-ribose pyranose/furanose isomerase RbsD